MRPDELTAWLVARLAALRGLDAGSIDTRERFSHYGLDSLGAGRLIAELSEVFGRRLSPTLVWEAPTIEALVQHLTGTAETAAPPADRPEEHDTGEPIAIVGLACRFPGAPDPQRFWRVLRDGVDAVGEVPDDRGWDEVLTRRGIDRAERAKVRRGGFLDRIDGFDPLFFGISPREATDMDPQQRLFLELAWEALEDARIRPSSLRGSRTGVFAGAIWFDYASLLFQNGPEGLGQYSVTGYHHSILANRVSYALGLMGPSLTLDSACSSGLVVAHLASESLRRGECTTALIGAVNLNVTAESALGVSRFGALSQDGHCYTFDARANGYVRGEGGGVAVLKTLSRAVADGDPIYCVIRASAVNNDGASNGMTAPNPAAQEAVLRTAYARAGIETSSVQYVEAHGTGTPLGDPIEAKALGAVLGAGRPADAPLLVGSAKTNIGHLEGAAGTVGMFKAALAIKHRLLPASLNFATPNPHAPLADLGLAVPTALGPWPAPERPLTAGISSFGLGGTNGHVVLQEWPAPRAEIVALAAETPEALGAEVERVRATLAADGGRTPITAIAADAASRCRPAPHRLAAVATSPAELERALAASAQPGAARADAGRGVVFVFPGQGSQWYGMARSLLQGEPVFRATLEACDRYIQRYLGVSLIAELTRSRAASRLGDIEVSLPAIISIDIAVSAWWRSMGIEPAAVVGHSTGEIAAAHVAGALDLDDTMRIICAYGRIIARQAGKGGMALVGLPWDETGAAIAGFEGRVFRAIQDSARGTVVAGEPAALDALLATLEPTGVFARRVSMNVAPHSPMVDGMRTDLFALIQGVRPRRGSVPLISEVTGNEVDGAALDAAHWVKNFGDPALFSTAVDTLIGRGHRVFLDVGPHPITAHSVEANLERAGARGVALSSLRRDEDERRTLLETLGTLHTLGLPVRWNELYPTADEREGAWLLPLSAKSKPALAAMASTYAERLRNADGEGHLADFAFAASVGRDHLPYRLAVVGRSRRDAAERLEAFATEGAADRVVVGPAPTAARPSVVLVFSGQGSQWVGMGKQLFAEDPVFRAKIEECDALLAHHVSWSLVDALQAPEERSRLGETEVVQPALFAIQVGIAEVLRASGITPAAVIGHSVGEVAAAHVAGVLSLPEAARLVAWRGRIMQKATGLGKMAWVAMPAAEAAKAISGREHLLAVAAVNDPGSVVLSGDSAALEEVLASVSRRGIEHKPLKVNYAFHSPQMDPLARELEGALGRIEGRKAAIGLYSTVTGAPIDGADVDAAYWGRNVREPVAFARAIGAALGDGHRLFVEVGPHPVLSANINQCMAEQKGEGAVVFTLRRQTDERAAMLSALGGLHVRGVDVDWKALHPSGGRLVALPTYPWQRERYWVDKSTHAGGARASQKQRDGHPLLGTGLSPADRPDAHYWEQRLGTGAPAFLADHRVQGNAVFPGSGYVEMALSAAREVYGEGGAVVEDVRFDRMLVLPPENQTRLVQTTLVEEENGGATVTISSRGEGERGWSKHAGAKLRHAGADEPPLRTEPPSHIQARCAKRVEGAEHYAAMRGRGLDYGACFQGVEHVWVGEGEALGRVSLPEDLAREAGEHAIHPALLDACLQVTAALLPPQTAGDTLVPAGVARVRLVQPALERGWVHVRLAPDASESMLSFDLTIVDDDGRAALEVGALRVVRIAAGSSGDGDALGNAAFTVAWRKKDLAPPAAERRADKGMWLVVLDAHGTGAATAAALRANGEACVEVSPGTGYERIDDLRWRMDPTRPADLDRLFAEAFGKQRACRGVVHCAALSAAAWAETSPETLEADLRSGTFVAVRLAQAILRLGLRDTPRLVFVTRGAQAVGERPGRAAVAQAPLWGLGRTIALEHPELECTRIDLPAVAHAGEAERLVRELLAGDGEREIALREGGRFVARLVRERLPPAIPPSLAAGGTYLVTGGLGGLGLSVARWMASQGARHLVLVGRSEPSAGAQEAIRAMEEAGAEVRVLRGDVSRASDVERMLGEVRDRMPPLRGVVHAAGVLDDRTLLELGEEPFWTPMRPKVLGAWNLHTATRGLPLDFFVMYSSVASLLGSPGQTAYTGANAFLDALSHARAADGLPAVSIQWGPFSEVGLAAALASRGGRLSHQGMESFTPQEGTELLSRALAHPRAEVGLVKVSLRQWIESHPQATGMRYLAELQSDEARPAGAGGLRETLAKAPEAERPALVMAYVMEQLGRVVRLDPSRLDPRAPFTSLGMDSLLSLELRNRLETGSGVRLPAAVLFTFPNPAAFTDHLMTLLAPAPEAKPAPAAATAAPPVAAPASDLEDLSGEDLLALLDEELSLARKDGKTK